MTKPLPQPASLRIFLEVWTEYAAILECSSSSMSVEAHNFLMDVESQVRRLYRGNQAFTEVHQRLIDDPACHSLRASRSAIGEAFLESGLWPVKHYFSNGR